MSKDFISISGISTLGQLENIERIVDEEKLNFPVVIGYQISHKSINTGTANPRQPKFSELDMLTIETTQFGFVPAFHYYTKDNETILPDLEKLIDICEIPEKALMQFNTLPPETETLRRVREIGFEIIFKVAVANKSQGGYAVWKGKETQDASSGDVSSLIEQVRTRKDWVSYAMFDASHGTNFGIDLNAESLAVRFGRLIRQDIMFDNIGLVYAGGINPKNVGNIKRELTKYFPGGFSIDVESGVRNLERDELSIKLVREYLINCKTLLEN